MIEKRLLKSRVVILHAFVFTVLLNLVVQTQYYCYIWSLLYHPKTPIYMYYPRLPTATQADLVNTWYEGCYKDSVTVPIPSHSNDWEDQELERSGSKTYMKMTLHNGLQHNAAVKCCHV